MKFSQVNYYTTWSIEEHGTEPLLQGSAHPGVPTCQGVPDRQPTRLVFAVHVYKGRKPITHLCFACLHPAMYLWNSTCCLSLLVRDWRRHRLTCRLTPGVFLFQRGVWSRGHLFWRHRSRMQARPTGSGSVIAGCGCLHRRRLHGDNVPKSPHRNSDTSIFWNDQLPFYTAKMCSKNYERVIMQVTKVC